MKAVAKKPAWSFPSPKKGKLRTFLKQKLTKKPASKITTTKAWQAVPYRRGGESAPKVDRLKWKRTFQYLTALSEKEAVDVLTRDGLLVSWEGATCPFCSSGKVGPLVMRASELPRYRCRRKQCHKFITPQHLHPLFTATRGPEGHSLGVQAGVLLLRLANVQLSSIHLVTQVNHKAIERLEHNLLLTRKAYVENIQRTMTFGGHKNSWQDVEVDESVFDKKLIPIEEAACADKNMVWEQWVGMVQRGKPQSLVLIRLSPLLLACASNYVGSGRVTHLLALC